MNLWEVISDYSATKRYAIFLTNEDGDDFRVRSIISSKDKFNQLVESTINALNEYPQFSKYSDDLEQCL